MPQTVESSVHDLDLTICGEPARFQSGLQQQPVHQAHQLLALAHQIKAGSDLAARLRLDQHPAFDIPRAIRSHGWRRAPGQLIRSLVQGRSKVARS